MRIEKIKIKKIQDLQEGLDLEASNWLIADNKIISYDVDHKLISENNLDAASEEENKILEDLRKKKEESWRDFVEKKQIRTGHHKLDTNEGMLKVPYSQEVFFETTTSAYLKKLFENFFEKSAILKDKFKRNKRAYLLYSEPGMGKSALIRNFCQHALNTDGTAIITVDGDINFNILSYIFLNNYAEDVKRIILVIEDFGKKDNAVSGTIYNPSCLNFLDGTSGLFRVPTMVLCTTNFVKELGPHLTNRPGRFNKLIRVVAPTDDEIFQLVEAVGNIRLSESQKNAFRGKKMSPDHVIESIIRHELEDITLEASIDEVMGERQGLIDW